jgi:hypothetical protein
MARSEWLLVCEVRQFGRVDETPPRRGLRVAQQLSAPCGEIRDVVTRYRAFGDPNQRMRVRQAEAEVFEWST